MLCTAAPLRLAAILGWLRRREWPQWVRIAIADPFMPLVCAAVIGVAGGEPRFALVSLSDTVGTVAVSLGQRSIINQLING